VFTATLRLSCVSNKITLDAVVTGTHVSRFGIQKYKDQDTLNCNFACCFYGCETWSFTLREEHKLRIFENRVLWKIDRPKGDKVTGEWRRLRNEEHYDRMIKSRRMRWADRVVRMGDVRGSWVGRSERKKRLEDLGVDG
jgi:hypothetical protein